MPFSMILAGALAATPASTATANRLTGDWIMDLYIGDKVFADQVSVRPGTGGGSGGSLTVPGRFTAPLEDVTQTGDDFSFTITADEGRGPFRVVYRGRFRGQDDVFVGFATLPDEKDKLLGGFVGRRSPAKP